MADDFNFAADVTRSDYHARRSAATTGGSVHDVNARSLSDKSAVRPDLRARTFNGPAKPGFRCATRGGFFRGEVQDLSGLGIRGFRGEREGFDLAFGDHNVGLRGLAVATCVNSGFASFDGADDSCRIHRGYVGQVGSPGEHDIAARVAA